MKPPRTSPTDNHEDHSPPIPMRASSPIPWFAPHGALHSMRRVEAGLWQRAHDLFIVKNMAKNIDPTLTRTCGDGLATDSSAIQRPPTGHQFSASAFTAVPSKNYNTYMPPQRRRPMACAPRNPNPGPSHDPQTQHSTTTSAKLVSFRQHPPPRRRPTASYPPGAPAKSSLRLRVSASKNPSPCDSQAPRPTHHWK